LYNLAKLTRPADPGDGGSIHKSLRGPFIFTPTPRLSQLVYCSRPISTIEATRTRNYGISGRRHCPRNQHSFDELGNIYDDQGRLGMWWTAEELPIPRGQQRSCNPIRRLLPLAGLCVNGKQVLSESIA